MKRKRTFEQSETNTGIDSSLVTTSMDNSSAPSGGDDPSKQNPVTVTHNSPANASIQRQCGRNTQDSIGPTIGQRRALQRRRIALKNFGILLALNMTLPIIALMSFLFEKIFYTGFAQISVSLLHVQSTLSVFNMLWRYKLIRDAFVQMIGKWKNSFLRTR